MRASVSRDPPAGLERPLRSLLRERENDFGGLAATYKSAGGEPLVGDVLRPGAVRATGKLSASVVVPAWNARVTLSHCLAALERCSFNLRFPGRLEVIVVD